jgi:peptide-methionine (R)-S-oxide reductase
VKCGNGLFHGKSKYAHHTPWPAFNETIREDSVRKEIETVPQESSQAKAMKVSRTFV